MPKIHPTAIIEDGAKLADDVEIGAYAYIGSEVELGAGTIISHHATVDGFTKMGKNNQVFPYAFIGGKTNDLKYKGGKTGLVIGDNNVFRQYTTAHLATADNTFTTIGNNNLFIAYSHVAHDCVVGNFVIMSAHTALGGHVRVDDHAVIGWNAGLHQFSRVGEYSMLGGCSKGSKDIPPFMMSDGFPAVPCSINKLNMQRNNFSEDEINLAFYAFKTIYKRGLSRKHAIAALEEHPQAQTSRVLKSIIAFAKEPSQRGF